jgi:hypothetical protein
VPTLTLTRQHTVLMIIIGFSLLQQNKPNHDQKTNPANAGGKTSSGDEIFPGNTSEKFRLKIFQIKALLTGTLPWSASEFVSIHPYL